MIEKVIIKDNKNTPINYLSELDAFKNGTEYLFKTGVNIIVGKNGSGKSTLLKLIERYLLVDKTECDVGMFNSCINRLIGFEENKFPDGVEVFADYEKNTFRLCHKDEMGNDNILSSFNSFNTAYMQKNSSTGEGVSIALNSLFERMFSKNAKLKFDYKSIRKIYPLYEEYVSKHQVKNNDEWTVLMDEPDRNLDVMNIKQIKGILSFHKEHTQIITVIHNPLLIYSLSKYKGINFIEMTKGYIKEINKIIEEK